ncbi:MAG: amidohydrolase family protein [Actinomycetota bacterium]|nr:amidohydrolase family protein [Actinomycetota bacterium]
MYIDAHTHVAQESWVAETWWQALARVGAEVLPGVTAEMVREAIIPALFDSDGSSQLGAMDAAGIHVAVMFPYDWSRADRLGNAATDWKEQNQWYRDFADRQPKRIRWGFGADPRQNGALEGFERAVREEGALCLKLHPAAGFSITDPSVYPFMETARDLGVPVVMHVGPNVAPLYSKWSNPILLDELAADFPSVKVQAAHTGNAAWRECLAVASVKHNVFCDLSGWQGRFARNSSRFYSDVREVLDTVGPHRVMWSTDGPHYRPLVSDADYLKAFTEAPDDAFSAEEIEWMTGRTAREFYELD